MKSRLLTGVLAAVMAITVIVGGTARPAKAVWQVWAGVALSVAQSLFSGGSSSGDLERAKREIIDAVNAARQEMLDHIDDIANADVRACTEASTALVAQIDLMDEYTLGAFVINAVNCASLSTAYFDAVQSPAAADNIGKLMGPIYAIAMVGFAKLGFPTVDLLDSLIRGYDAVVAKLTPTSCTRRRVQPPFDEPAYWYWICTAYNGNTGRSDQMNTPDGPGLAQAENRASANTSRAVAQNALPTLRQLRAAMG